MAIAQKTSLKLIVNVPYLLYKNFAWLKSCPRFTNRLSRHEVLKNELDGFKGSCPALKTKLAAFVLLVEVGRLPGACACHQLLETSAPRAGSVSIGCFRIEWLLQVVNTTHMHGVFPWCLQTGQGDHRTCDPARLSSDLLGLIHWHVIFLKATPWTPWNFWEPLWHGQYLYDNELLQSIHVRSAEPPKKLDRPVKVHSTKFSL